MIEVTELERRCVDAALDARIGALANGPEGHMRSIVRATLLALAERAASLRAIAWSMTDD